MIRVALGCVALLALGACVDDAPPATAGKEPAATEFVCDGGRKLAVMAPSEDEIRLRYEGRWYRLTARPSGSGFRFADRDLDFMGQADLALLAEIRTGAVLAANCKRQKA